MEINDFKSSEGRMRDLIDDCEHIETRKNYYYQEAKKMLDNFNVNINVIHADDEGCGKLIFEVYQDIKFQLTIKNRIRFIIVDLQLFETDDYSREYLSNEYRYSFTIGLNDKFSDVDTPLESNNYKQHFRHILITLMKNLGRIED
ncbi:hypothetical protein ACU6ZR_18100 [Klebsiella aerogenes]|uniref:hypothetical protein n=1 Tax=Klebsiella aerogenes TaxID=548 RepID=UPI0031D92E01